MRPRNTTHLRFKNEKVYSERVFEEFSEAEGILRLGDSVLLKTQGKTAG